MESERVVDLISLDIDSLIEKMSRLLPPSKEVTLASGLMVAASHILGGQAQSPPGSQIQGRGIEQDQEGDDEHEETPPVHRRKRSLADEWAGPLQSRNTSSAGRAQTAQNRAKKSYRIVDPRTPCPECGDPCGDHPINKNMREDKDGRKPRVLCDQTIIYSFAAEGDEPE